MKFVEIFSHSGSAVYKYNEKGSFSFTKLFGETNFLSMYAPHLPFEEAVKYIEKYNKSCHILTEKEVDNIKIKLL